MNADPASLYRIHGLLVESEIPLQAQRVDAHGGGWATRGSQAVGPRPDYRIVAGEPRKCPQSPPPGRILAEYREDGFASFVTEDPRDRRRRSLRYAGICDVLLDSGRRRIVVHRSLDGREGMIPIFLEGNVLANALAADGVLALHASAVEVGGEALAIVGPSGAGKSTLAGLLCAAGARLVADDTLRVDPAGTRAVCFPGSVGLRLRPAAATVADSIREATVHRTADGRTKVVPASAVGAPLTLRAAVVPEASREAKRLEMRRLGAMEGLQELLRHPRLTLWRAPEPIADLFALTSEVAATGLPVLRARIPWGPPFPPRLVEEMLAEVGFDTPPADDDPVPAKNPGAGPAGEGSERLDQG